MTEKIYILNVNIAFGDPHIVNSQAVDTTELDKLLEDYEIRTKEVVVPPQSSSYYSIVFKLLKK